MKNDIINIIYESIDEINELNEINIDKAENSVLYGMESELDSLGLVNLIVTIESKVNNKFNKSFSLTDEKALSQKNSPFKNVTTLTNYISQLITNEYEH